MVGQPVDPIPLAQLVGTCGDTAQDRVVILMVGLPACGKTHIARRIKKFLEFFHGIPVRVFNVGEYRRKVVGAKQSADFFDASNTEALRQRLLCRDLAMDDMKGWLSQAAAQGPSFGRVAIFDATNTTRERRRWALDQLKPLGVQVMLIESICNNEKLVHRNICEVKLHTPDYLGMDPEAAVKDFKQRRQFYCDVYEEVDGDGSEKDLSYVKIINLEEYIVHRVKSYILGRITEFLLYAHIAPNTIFLTRNGESEYDEAGRIGGNSSLTDQGQEFATHLASYIKRQTAAGDPLFGSACIGLWTSTLKSAQETAEPMTRDEVTHPPKMWHNLDDIYTGMLEGKTLEEIREDYEVEHSRRDAWPMGYRWPRGESYMDVINRLEPVVLDLERKEAPLLIVTHEAVMRVLYCYLTGRDREQAPLLVMPQHTVICLRMHAYGCDEERMCLVPQQEVPRPLCEGADPCELRTGDEG